LTSLEKLVGQVYGNIGASEPNNNNNNNRGGNGKRDTNSNNNNRDKRPRIVDALEIVRSKCLSLFVDQIGEPYAAIKVKDHIETIAIGSNRFKEWVIKACYDYKKEQQNQLQKLQQEQLARTQGNDSFHSEQEGAAKPANEYGISETTSDSSSPVLLLGNEDAAKIQTIIKLEAEQTGNQEKLEIRVAGNVDPNTEENNQNYNVIYYDLNNKDGQIIKVTSDDWHIEKHGCSNNSNSNNSGNSSSSSTVVTTSLNILFKHYRNQLPQAHPSKEYPKDIFIQFMNLTNLPLHDKENRILAEVYTISLFLPPDFPKPILIPYGEQGSAKSTFQEFIKSLVDPCGALTLSFPASVAELVQQLSHNYVAYYDNVSRIRQWISDVLCRGVTGSGFSKRQLYTDDEDIIYRFRRCIGFNGINVAATRPDLLERSLMLHLKRIPKEKRRKLTHLWKLYERIKPQVLGFIFDTLVQVLKNVNIVQLKELPRMADWAEIGEVISRCLGYPDNAFLDAYYKNIGLQTEQAIEASPVAIAIREFMNSKKYWKGTATELLSELENTAEDLKIKIKNNRQWPSAPNSLSRKLNEVRTNLREVGIIIERPVDTKINTILVEIMKVSPRSPVSPEDPNQAQLPLENTGDIDGDIHLTQKQISQDISPENHLGTCAQKEQTGDIGHTGDVVHISTIHRIGHSDTWGCKYCNQKGDKWFMQKHICRGRNESVKI
jgi:phage antirepressor YoqD-like protein